ncbi:MAG: HAD-IIIA family hydrolase [Phycisphaerales bacterium]
MTAAIFLDRDDTLMECNSLPAPPSPAKAGDVIDPRLVRVLPGVPEGLSALSAAGFALVVVSNQGVVARGGGTCEQVEAVNDRLREQIELEGGPKLSAMYYCPYHPLGKVPRYAVEHEWRKPQGGMVRAAARDLGLDLSRSWMIGDAMRDLEAGIDAGLAASRCVLVGPEAEVADVLAASRHVLRAIGVVSGKPTVTVMMRGVPEADLDDRAVRDTVLASVHGVAERAGVTLHEASVKGGVLRVTIEGDRLAGIGLLAEVRRLTNRWHEARRGGDLWMGDFKSDED